MKANRGMLVLMCRTGLGECNELVSLWKQECVLGVVKLGEKGMNQPRLRAAFRLLPGFCGVCHVI